MTNIRFNNLPKLLNSMRTKGWVIDSFLFNYNNHRYIVILKTYSEAERKPSKFAKVKLEFIKADEVDTSIYAYADFYDVHFKTVKEFCDFFNIHNQGIGRDIFNDFSNIFARCIPEEKVVEKDERLRQIQGGRCEGNNPNAIYCYDVQRNGRNNGRNNTRSIENSNKAETLRPTLYNKYKDDTNLSFYFSTKPEDERTDEEIFNLVASRV